MDLKKLEAIVKIEPNNPSHWFNLGIAYLKENRISDAYKAFEESVKVNPYFAPSQFLVGLLLLYGRDFKNGLKYLEKAITIDENVFRNLSNNRAIKDVLDELINLSIKVLKDQLEFQGTNIENLNTMGKILLYIGFFESAINYFRKVIELKPDNIDAYLNLGVSYESLREYEQAIFYLKKCIALNPYFAEAYWIMGRVYLKIGNHGIALKNFEKAVEHSPNTIRYLNSLANIYILLNKNYQAIKTLQLAIDINPNSKWSYYYLGQCLEKEYNFELAIEQYEKALNIDPYFREAKLALVRLYQFNNNVDAAIKILEKMMEEDESDYILYFNLAQLYFTLRDYRKAREYIEKYIEYFPSDQNAHHLFSMCLLNLYKENEKSVDVNELIEKLEKLYKYNDKDVIIAKELFNLYINTNQIDKAKLILQNVKFVAKDKEMAKSFALIYLYDDDYQSFLETVKEHNIYSYDFISKVFSLLKEKQSSFLSLFFSETLESLRSSVSKEEFIKICIEYLEYVYYTNTLQAYDLYNKLFELEDIRSNNLFYFELLILFTLYSEYSDKRYLDSFINKADEFLISYEKVKTDSLIFSSKINLNINLVVLFYFVFIKNKLDLIPKIYDLLMKEKEFENNVLRKVLELILPLFIEVSYYKEVEEIIKNFELDKIQIFKVLKIECLFLMNRFEDSFNETEDYVSNFGFDSYVELLRIASYLERFEELDPALKDSLMNIVKESNPLALAIYSFILSRDDEKEAIRVANRAMEFLYTGNHPFKYSYQLLMCVSILAKVFESLHKISLFLKGLRQVSLRYPDNFGISFIFAKYLFLTEDFVDCEMVLKKALNLAKSSEQFLEAQKLLAKVREEKEKYYEMLSELEKISHGISEKIASINSLYKKGDIEKINSILDSLDDTSIDSIILKFYIFDKLEITGNLIYYLNILKMVAIENRYDKLLDLLENKLLIYSNFSEFEEIKQKAELDYIKIFRSASLVKEKQEISTESESTELESTELESSGKESAKESVKESMVGKIEEESQEENLQNIVLLYYKLLYFWVFQKDETEYQKIESIIQNLKNQSKIDSDSLVYHLENIKNKIISNDEKGLVIELKDFVQKYKKDFVFYVYLLLAIVSFKLKKRDDFKKYLNLAKQSMNVSNDMAKDIIELMEKHLLEENVQERVSLSQLEKYDKFSGVMISNVNELILAYFIKIFYILFQPDKANVIDEIEKLISNYNAQLDDKYNILIGFLKDFSEKIKGSDVKDVLGDIKGFASLVGKDKFFVFFTYILMMFISYKLGKYNDYEKYRDLFNKLLKDYPIFEKIAKFLEEVKK